MDELTLAIAPVEIAPVSPVDVAEWPQPIAARRPVCRVCSVPHDDEIHAATLSIRRWLRDEVTKYLADDSPIN
jgi:hypothetical protein